MFLAGHCVGLQYPSPDMSAWRYETSTGAPESPAGYGVLDAFGLRIGVLEGWIRDASGEVQLVVIAVRTLLRTTRHAVPLGYVVQFDTRRRQLHLRELTRRSLPQRCPRMEGAALPPDTELAGVLHEAPHVRPEIREMMRDPARGLRPMRPGRLTPAPEQGDGRSSGPPPLPDPWIRLTPEPALAAAPATHGAPTAAGPAWTPLSTLHTPTWQRLSDLEEQG
jgi:hypothetical protein